MVCSIAFRAIPATMLATMLALTVQGSLCGPAASVNVQFLGLRPQRLERDLHAKPKRARLVWQVCASIEPSRSNSRISDVQLPRREVYSVLGSVSLFSIQYIMGPSMLGTALIATLLPYLMGGPFT